MFVTDESYWADAAKELGYQVKVVGQNLLDYNEDAPTIVMVRGKNAPQGRALADKHGAKFIGWSPGVAYSGKTRMRLLGSSPIPPKTFSTFPINLHAICLDQPNNALLECVKSLHQNGVKVTIFGQTNWNIPNWLGKIPPELVLGAIHQSACLITTIEDLAVAGWLLGTPVVTGFHPFFGSADCQFSGPGNIMSAVEGALKMKESARQEIQEAALAHTRTARLLEVLNCLD